MKRTNIYLSKPQLEQMRLLAEATGISMSELIRRIIDEFLKNQ
jgi:predicted DNA binding CopG/RHH family protein